MERQKQRFPAAAGYPIDSDTLAVETGEALFFGALKL